MKKFLVLIAVLIGATMFTSCSDLFESNPFIGTWFTQIEDIEDGINYRVNMYVTFFDDNTYGVEAKFSAYGYSEALSFTTSGNYKYNEKYIVLFDDDLFQGEQFVYSIQKDILKLSDDDGETWIFRKVN